MSAKGCTGDRCSIKGDWAIAGKPNTAAPTPGQMYEVRHSRKGTFKVRVLAVEGEWARCVILVGVAKAVMQYNVKYEEDEVTIRDTLSYWIPLEEL